MTQSQVERGAARTPEQIREHCEIERELARRLMSAPREERRRLYTEVYDELFRRVPHHPQLTMKADAASRRAEVEMQMNLLRRFLRPGMTFLELGAGDCGVSFATAPVAERVFAVEVAETIASSAETPENFALVLSDGTSVPVEPGSVDVAYSNQLMEHLHPEDALDQLRSIHRALRPGGCYVCITPNRFRGPIDISRYFDRVATGLHLREYSLGELTRHFREVGVRRLRFYAGGKGKYLRLPVTLVRALELSLSLLPWKIRSALARRMPLKAMLGITLVGYRP
jgi:SAM-dependent methyltransferase